MTDLSTRGMDAADDLASLELLAAPIRPEWVIDGAPVARALQLNKSRDRLSSTSVWDCTAGTFRWYFGGDETVHILDGEVVVDDGHEERTLERGDVALFHAHTWAQWHVPRYVRKLAFCKDAVPRPVGFGLRVVGRLRDRFGRGPGAGRLG